MPEATDAGVGDSARTTSCSSTDSSKPKNTTSFQWIASARQQELSQIPEETPPVPRQRQHHLDAREHRVLVSHTKADADGNAFGGDDSLHSSKRDKPILERSRQRSIISDTSSHQVENDNDIDGSSVMSRRSALSHYGGSDWSIGAEADESKVSGLLRRWEVMIPTGECAKTKSTKHLKRQEDLQQLDDVGHLALTESALRQLSQQLEGGAVGRFSMAHINSRTAKAERIAHEMEAAMAWWKDHGLDMNASASSLLEMPAPFATLEEEQDIQSSSLNNRSVPDWWNKNHELEDDRLDKLVGKIPPRFQGQATLPPYPSTVVAQQQQPSLVEDEQGGRPDATSSSSWRQPNQGQTANSVMMTKTSAKERRCVSPDEQKRADAFKVAESHSSNEAKAVLTPQQSPKLAVDPTRKESFTSGEEDTDDLIREQLLSRPAENSSQATATDESEWSSTFVAEKVSDNDEPIVVSSSNSSSVGGNDIKVEQPTMGTANMGSLTANKQSVTHDKSETPESVEMKIEKNGGFGRRGPVESGRSVLTVEQGVDHTWIRPKEIDDEQETFNEKRQTFVAGALVEEDIFASKVTDDVDVLKQVQLELGLTEEAGTEEGKAAKDSEEDDLDAELQAIRLELGIDTREMDGSLSRDCAIAVKDHLERDLLRLRRELGIVAMDDATDLANTREGKSVSATQNLSKNIENPMDRVSPLRIDATDANVKNAVHVLAVSAVVAVELEESPEMKKTKDMELTLAASVALSTSSLAAAPSQAPEPANHPTNRQIDSTTASCVQPGQPSLLPWQSSPRRPGAVAVPGIRGLLGRSTGISASRGSTVSRSLNETTPADAAVGIHRSTDFLLVSDPTDLLVSATLVDQTDTDTSLVVVRGEPLSESLPFGVLIKNRWVRATSCLILALCIALVASTAVSIPGLVNGRPNVQQQDAVLVGGESARPTPSPSLSSAVREVSGSPSRDPAGSLSPLLALRNFQMTLEGRVQSLSMLQSAVEQYLQERFSVLSSVRAVQLLVSSNNSGNRRSLQIERYSFSGDVSFLFEPLRFEN